MTHTQNTFQKTRFHDITKNRHFNHDSIFLIIIFTTIHMCKSHVANMIKPKAEGRNPTNML